MKGKIIKIEDNKIVARPCENFLDVVVDSCYSDAPLIGKEVEISFRDSVFITIDNKRFYGKFIDE